MGGAKDEGQEKVRAGRGTEKKEDEEVRKINGAAESVKFGEADKVKSEMKSKYGSSLSGPLKKISNIFIPLIPAFIGSGLIMGINNLIVKWEWVQPGTLTALLAIFGNVVFAYMNIMVGMNTAKEFGGSPALGGVMGGILLAPGLADIELFGKALVPGRGGIIAVLLVVAFSSFIEKKLRKSIPESLELIYTNSNVKHRIPFDFIQGSFYF